jgi:peptidoglycan/xylan/chitin deacetylase (PgdA/CDA1 family)
MAKVRLAFCIYAENPYGDPERLATEPKYRSIIEETLKGMDRINRCFGKTPRTYFCVGSHLEALEQYAGARAVRKAYGAVGVEVANHTYSHVTIQKVHGIDAFYPRTVLTPQQVTAELQQTNAVLRRIFKQRGPFGFSATCGYAKPLDLSVAQAIKAAGCAYSHSWIRGNGGSFFADFHNPDGTLRQPFRYKNRLWEIPHVGWQDVFNWPKWANAIHGMRFGKCWPTSPKGILRWWRTFLVEAITLSEQHGDIALTCMLHPSYIFGIPFIDRWGLVHWWKGYDPKLRALRGKLRIAERLSVDVVQMRKLFGFGEKRGVM